MSNLSGWIKTHKKLLQWEWYSDSHMVHLFIHLLLTAAHKDGSWRGVDIKRGQAVVGRSKLSNVTGISEQSIRTCLERLKSTGEITIEATSKHSLITIVNYDEYQGESEGCQPANQPASQPTINQQSTTSEEGKEYKKIKNTSFNPAAARPDWIDEQQWKDIIAHRKAVKAANTERAYKNLVGQLTEAVSRGFTLDECIDAMTDKRWIGFKAEWMKNLQGRQPAEQGAGVVKPPKNAAAAFARELLVERYGTQAGHDQQSNKVVEHTVSLPAPRAGGSGYPRR